MRSRQGKVDQVVIELGWLPGSRGMTLVAGLRQIELHVVRVGGFLEIIQVATYARRGRVLVASGNVALRTVELRVRPSQGVSREPKMIKKGAGPSALIVALCTLDRQLQCNVIDVARALVVLGVAGITGRR